MRIAWRGAELRLLLPIFLLVPLGFAITNVALTGVFDGGPLHLAIGYVALLVGAHLLLVVLGHRGDQLILPAVGAMGGIGMIMLNRLPQDLAGTSAFGIELGMAATQLLWFGVGMIAMLVIAVGLRDDGILRHYKYSWAAAGILLLGATLLLGYEVNGARLWIDLGPVSVQPGEFLKIVLVIFIAGYLAETRTLLTSARLRIGFLSIPPLPYFLPMLALFAVVMLIVVRLNDLGTALLFFGTFLTMLFVATGRRSYVLIGLILFVVGFTVAYQFFGHVQTRVDIWLDPFADPLGAGFQPVRALYALGRGGIFGEGLGQGLVTLGGGLTIPYVHTDFIFTAVAEELGLLGAFALLGFAAVLVFRGLRIAALARDDFSGLLAVGLTASLGLQTLIIIGGNTKLIPLTGITLPFVSYGGSSVLASFIMIGLLLAISHKSAIGADVDAGS
ncbi:MAG: FtsW/RodA/SpoVE family cell cycle protein [Chloroflexi bacterium]|nr:FtsW/RodA/SpoVE family cell cycle protein [Chloroflexota bacterium]MBA3740257.1 FtsW/RodA/SpoVE family cell cycle protein [Chloroflexota bacterium]